MTITTYLLYPIVGKEEEMNEQLEALPGLDLYPSDDCSVTIVLSEASDAEEEVVLQKRLKSLPAVQYMTLTYSQEVSDNE